MVSAFRWAIPALLVVATWAMAQPPVPPPVPPLTPPAANPPGGFPSTVPIPGTTGQPGQPGQFGQPAAPNPTQPANPNQLNTPNMPSMPSLTPPGQGTQGSMDASRSNTPPTSISGRNINEWVVDFRSADPTVREQAVKVIGFFGQEAVRKHAIKGLISLLDDQDPGVRINAMLIMAASGFDKVDDLKTATEKLSNLLGNTSSGSIIRLHATRAIGAFGIEAHSAVNAVIQMADDPSWETRQAAAITLGRIGGMVFDDKAIVTNMNPNPIPIVKRTASKAAMDRLNFKLIRDPSAAVRMEACHSLVLLGPPYTADPNHYPAMAKPYIDVISARVKGLETDQSVRVWLMLLHIMYDDREMDKSLKTIASSVAAKDPQVQIQALTALGVLGAKSKPVMKEITAALYSQEPFVAYTAINTVMSMGMEARAAQPDLEQLALSAKNKDIQLHAREAVNVLNNVNKRPNTPVVQTPAPSSLPAKKP